MLILLTEKTPADKFAIWRTVARAAAIDPQFRAHVYNIAKELGVKDMRQEAPAMVEHIARNFIYTPEIFEFYTWPLTFSAAPLGDCDDQAIYIAAFLDVIGVKNEFVIVADEQARDLLHVYLELPEQKITFDYTLAGKPLDMEPLKFATLNARAPVPT